MADQNLPEGTDTIISDDDIAATSGSGGGATGASAGVGTGTYGSTGESAGAGSGSIIGSGQTGGTGSTGGELASTSSGGTGASGGGNNGGVKQALKNSTDKIRSTAGDRAMGLVSQGLERSSGALTNVSSIIGETAETIEQRLGPQYGEYARKAAQAIEGYAGSLANKDPEELFEDARSVVRKSPAVALAGAAIVGFALVRVVKAGLDASGTTGGTASGGASQRD